MILPCCDAVLQIPVNTVTNRKIYTINLKWLLYNFRIYYIRRYQLGIKQEIMGSRKVKYALLIKRLSINGLAVLLFACGGGSEQASVPIVLDAAIAYVKRPVQFDNNGNLVPIDITDPIAFNPGGDLYIRDVAAAVSDERNITQSFTGGMGDVKDVEFSADGEKIIFAMRAADLPNTQPEDQPKWDIWEYEIATDTLSRVIQSDSVAQEHQDVSPAYLPDGQIIFTSTRQQDNQGILGNEGKPAYPGLTENRQQPALVLHRMRDNGTFPTQLSFNQSHDFDPIVLSSGRILFSRWDNAGGRNSINLYSVNPDGTDLQIVYGAHSHNTGSNNSTIQFLKTTELENGNILALLAPLNGQRGGGLLASIDINNYIDNTSPTSANVGLLGPAQVNLVNTNILTDGSPSPGGLYSTAYPLNDGTSRYLVSWTPCRLQDPANGTILPCSTDNLANTNLVEAPPLYGLFMFDGANNTQVPVVEPQEGIIYTDIAAASPKPISNFIPDKTTITGLDQNLIDEEVGILNIRSVYDMDGTDTAPVGIDVVADPGLTTADQRPARFLRVVKAVSIPDDESLDGDPDTSLDNSAFGVSTAQGMREIIGYAPIEPDGSVKVKVPANIPFAISILDKNGKRISQRHLNWIQVRKGDTLTCNGCHNHVSGSPHGRPDGPPSIYTGGSSNGGVFTNTLGTFWHELGETMAETRTRHDPNALDLSVDIKFVDVWTDPDPMAANRPADAPFSYLYADLTTASAPATTNCQTQWQTTYPPCRTVINYETHIHPLWSVDRGGNTCINCHTTAGGTQVPAGITQLDLTDGISTNEPNHEKAYQELLAADNQQILDMGALTDYMVQATDPNTGALLFLTDVDGNQILDGMGNPIPVMIPVPITSAMSTAGAAASSIFFNVFETGSHAGYLTEAELKLIAEWLDIGGQYLNNPFDADNRFIN